MRAIIEIGEHSVYVPGLEKGGEVIDLGANKGRFSQEIAARFPVKVVSVEANPHLAEILRDKGLDVVHCAVGGSERSVSFHIGTNDEASSLHLPGPGDVHLVVMQTVHVPMKPLDAILREKGISRLACVKVDIEGSEIDVFATIGESAKLVSPQWTAEFHDAPEFGLCTSAQVDGVISAMMSNGFNVLVRNWPSRTNVLFVDRSALSIGFAEWVAIKFRYQYIAVLWRIFGRAFGLIH